MCGSKNVATVRCTTLSSLIIIEEFLLGGCGGRSKSNSAGRTIGDEKKIYVRVNRVQLINQRISLLTLIKKKKKKNKYCVHAYIRIYLNWHLSRCLQHCHGALALLFSAAETLVNAHIILCMTSGPSATRVALFFSMYLFRSKRVSIWTGENTLCGDDYSLPPSV